MLFSLKEKPKICYMYFNKKPSLDFKKLEKLSAMEPKVVLLNCIFLFNSVQQLTSYVICWSFLPQKCSPSDTPGSARVYKFFSWKACRNSRLCSPTPMKNPNYASPSLLFPTCHILSSKLQGTCSKPPSSL